MPCTTLLVGKKASYDVSTIMARNDDSSNGNFTPKRVDVVHPQDQPKIYRSVTSHVEVDLSDETPVRYTYVPDAVLERKGIWGAAGINAHEVAMTACETITSNERVLGADPLVELRPAQGVPESPDFQPEVPGGIGEEDMVTLVLPYIASAREGVLRLGSLLEQYGTYEMNGIGFSDLDEVWWLETVGGHHWIARRVPDDCYVTMPNQLGIDSFDLEDAEGPQREHMCSADLRAWMKAHHLDLTLRSMGDNTSVFNPREAFGRASDADHVYNTPRAWMMQRVLNPRTEIWDGPNARYTPESDDIPWARRPERLITIEDIKRVLSLHYQGTPYDVYDPTGKAEKRYRPIAVNGTDHLAVLQLRPYAPAGCRGVQWMALGSNTFNALVPLYAGVGRMPTYLSYTDAQVSTESFYWANRLVAALADRCYFDVVQHIERYQQAIGACGHEMLYSTDAAADDAPDLQTLLEEANDRMAATLRQKTDELLGNALHIASMGMRNAFARSDG